MTTATQKGRGAGKPASSIKRRFRDRPRIRTGLSILPSLFTIGNMFCGYYSVVSTLRGNYDYAALAIGLGAVLDMLDGRIARLTNTSSNFGLELDSLADVLTFGIAPAVLALNWGIGSLEGLAVETAQDVYKFGWLTTFGFLIAGALRLARFNVLALQPSERAKSKRHFVGLPIPMAAITIAAIVHFRPAPVEMLSGALVWCVLILALGFLMISTLKYPSFKDVDLRKPLPRKAIVATGMLIGLVVLYSEITLLVIALVYAGWGPGAELSRLVRERFLDREERHPGPHPDSRENVS
jgi:CDP-diacylglycerol--serine O-phosphatidyltransferase